MVRLASAWSAVITSRRRVRGEVVAVSYRLRRDEQAVQDQRRERGEGQLDAGELRARSARGERRQYRLSVARVATVARAAPVPSGLKDHRGRPDRHPDEADGGGKSSTLARDTVFAAVMITCNGIVGLTLLVASLRHGTAVDGHSEHEGAEGFADSVGDHFGVVHGSQDGPCEDRSDERDDCRGQLAPPGGDQQDDREGRHEGRPPRRE
jgi:hypothetical protein